MTGSVAVIIPAFDAASCLHQALASVAGQTVAPDEVVVADDCSTDCTGAVARRWADRLPLTVVRTTTNGGPSVARRLAIEESHSPVLALLDADDVWLPDHLATLTALHRRVGGLVMADEIRWVPGDSLGARWSELYRVPPPARQLRALLRENWVNSRVAFARSLYDEAGGFRPGLRVGEDWDLWIRMARTGAAVTQAGHPTVLARLMAGSLTADDRGITDRLAVLELAAAEASDGSERDAAASGLRRLRAEADLVAAYGLAGTGRHLAARRRALGAVRGPWRVAVRGAGMAVAPRTVASRRAARRSEPRARLRG